MKKRYFLVAALALLGIGLYVISLFPAIQADPVLRDMTKVRAMMQGILIYANDHDEKFPPVDGWEQALIAPGYIDQQLFVLASANEGVVSFIYLGGMNSFDPTQIVIYQDPKHWPKHGVIVGFADGHIEMVPFDIFEPMLAKQQLDSQP